MKPGLSTVALLAGVFIPFIATADDYSYNTAENRDAFGVRAGIEITSTSGDDDNYSNGVGGSIGAVYTKYLYRDFYIEPGAYLYYDTFGQNITATSEPADVPVEVDGSIRNFGFRVPVNVGYRLSLTDDMGLKFFTGPQMNVSLVARSHFNDEEGVEKIDDESILGKKGFKRFDLQWNFGVGLDYNRWFVGITASAGVSKVMNRTYERFRRNYVMVAVGYTF